MNNAVRFEVTATYGSSESKMFTRIEGLKFVTYGFRIDYDENGRETGRTEPTALSSMFFGDEKPHD